MFVSLLDLFIGASFKKHIKTVQPTKSYSLITVTNIVYYFSVIIFESFVIFSFEVFVIFVFCLLSFLYLFLQL